MKFRTPRGEQSFEIPDDWWRFAEMDEFSRNNAPHFPFDGERYNSAETLPIVEIVPPRRNADVPFFRKYKLVPVLFGFVSPEYPLPPVKVKKISAAPYCFELLNGFHRYYASIAVGYTSLPAIVVAE